MRFFLLTFCLFIILPSFQRVAFASCSVKPTVAVAAKKSSVIFVGTVTKIVSAQTASASYPIYPLNGRKLSEWEKTLWNVDVVTFSVTEAFKGLESETIDIATGADGFAGYKFEGGTWLKEGQSYLVYGYKREPLTSKEIPKKLIDEINEFNSNVSRIESNVCTRTVNTNFAEEELEQIRGIFPESKHFTDQTNLQQINEEKVVTTTFWQQLFYFFGFA